MSCSRTYYRVAIFAFLYAAMVAIHCTGLKVFSLGNKKNLTMQSRNAIPTRVKEKLSQPTAVLYDRLSKTRKFFQKSLQIQNPNKSCQNLFVAASVASLNAKLLGGSDSSIVDRIKVNVSLDESVIPPPVPPLLVGATTTVIICIAIAFATRVPAMLSSVRRSLFRSLFSIRRLIQRINFGGTVSEIQYSVRLFVGSIQAWIDELRLAFHRAFGNKDIALPADDWSICTLHERCRISDVHTKYKFKFPDEANILPLELGQEIMLCGLDLKGQVVSGSFIPLSPRRQQGYFEIVVNKALPLEVKSLSSLPMLLQSLALGDELAVRPGVAKLQYKGPPSPITDIVMIASGLGVVPMLQFVTELLPSRESSVLAATIIWVNENAEDFSLYDELEKAFYKYHRKLEVSCIIERDLFGNAIMSNVQLREAVPSFHSGTLATVAGPDYFNSKVRDYLLRMGYPADVVISL